MLRNAAFAAEFRPRYLRDIPLTYFSSVVVQELLAGARTPREQRQVAALYEPFERARKSIGIAGQLADRRSSHGHPHECSEPRAISSSALDRARSAPGGMWL